MPIETWFPTVIYFEDVAVPDAAHALAMDVVREVLAEQHPGARLPSEALDSPNDLHLDPRLDPLILTLIPPILSFVFDGLQIDPERTQVYMGRCWPLAPAAEGPGEWQVRGGAVVSGVFHLEAPSGSGGIAFQRTLPSSFDHLPMKKRTELTFHETTYPAVRHRLMLFASDLRHRALPAAPDAAGPHGALAFDLYALTDIGIARSGMPPFRDLKRIG